MITDGETELKTILVPYFYRWLPISDVFTAFGMYKATIALALMNSVLRVACFYHRFVSEPRNVGVLLLELQLSLQLCSSM